MQSSWDSVGSDDPVISVTRMSCRCSTSTEEQEKVYNNYMHLFIIFDKSQLSIRFEVIGALHKYVSMLKSKKTYSCAETKGNTIFTPCSLQINFTKTSNNNEMCRSSKSKENIHKKEVGPYRGFGY